MGTGTRGGQGQSELYARKKEVALSNGVVYICIKEICCI